MGQTGKVTPQIAKSRLFRIKFLHLLRIKKLYTADIAFRLGISVYQVRERARNYNMPLNVPPRRHRQSASRKEKEFNPGPDDEALLDELDDLE